MVVGLLASTVFEEDVRVRGTSNCNRSNLALPLPRLIAAWVRPVVAHRLQLWLHECEQISRVGGPRLQPVALTREAYDGSRYRRTA